MAINETKTVTQPNTVEMWQRVNGKRNNSDTYMVNTSSSRYT